MRRKSIEVSAMITFPVYDRSLLIGRVAGAVAFVAIFMYFVVPLGGSALLAIMLVGMLIGGITAVREVREIRVGPGGVIQFARLLGTTTILARNVLVLEGLLKNEYDGTVWKMRVRHVDGSVTTADFSRATEFVRRLHELNPRVTVTGEWPMPISEIVRRP